MAAQPMTVNKLKILDPMTFPREISLLPLKAAVMLTAASGALVPMETRVALIGIVVENPDSVDQLNALLHLYREYIIGRMGVPYPKKKVSIISVAIDAPGDIISALSGKLGKLPGVSTKTVYSRV